MDKCTRKNLWFLDLIEESPTKEAMLEYFLDEGENDSSDMAKIIEVCRDTSPHGGAGLEGVKALNKRVEKL